MLPLYRERGGGGGELFLGEKRKRKKRKRKEKKRKEKKRKRKEKKKKEKKNIPGLPEATLAAP